jgi:hypothetical protein
MSDVKRAGLGASARNERKLLALRDTRAKELGRG